MPATLKEAQQLLQGEAPAEAWLPLLPGYRGLEVEADYGGVRQRWLVVESEARAREEEGGLRRRVARAEGEAEKALGRLLSRSFACEADARRALEEASGKAALPPPGPPGGAGGAAPGTGGASEEGGGAPTASWPAWEAGAGEAGPRTLPPGHGRPGPGGPAGRRCWGGTRTRPGRWSGASAFSKAPLFFTGSTFLKRPERVMALALLVYALGEWALRRGLAETGFSLPDQKGKPTQRPTLRWVFQLFIWVRLVVLESRPLVLNLASHHETAVRLLGAGRYYLLE